MFFVVVKCALFNADWKLKFRLSLVSGVFLTNVLSIYWEFHGAGILFSFKWKKANLKKLQEWI